MIVPLFVGREKSIKALEEVMRSDTFILLATQKNASDDDPATDSIFEVGTLASVLQLLKLPDGTVKVLVEGATRAQGAQVHRPRRLLRGRRHRARRRHRRPASRRRRWRARSSPSSKNYVKLNKKVSPEVVGVVQQIEDYAKLADTVASHLAVKIPDKQDILETPSVTERLEKVLGLMESEISVLQVEKRIRTRVKRQMEKTQREYYLNEQMKAIQKELGDEEGKRRARRARRQDQEDQALQGSPREGDARAQEAAPDVADVGGSDRRAQLSRLAAVDPVEQEDARSRRTSACAEEILDADHYGLEKVKERIVEYLAVQQRANKLTGPILCLVGPPGVGKTSLGKSIAKATGREFVRVSLGGVRDEAEIRGHRRTYIGSMPGKIIQSMRKAKTSNPLFLLDEVDKMGADFRGDPSSALARGARPGAEPHLQRPLSRGRLRSLERDVHHHGEHAQHPAAADGPHGDHPHRRLHRGREGRDRAQAPDPARGRQARPRCRRNGRSTTRRCCTLIRRYTREAGVRNLERELSTLIRKAVKELMTSKKKAIAVTAANLGDYLGVPKYPLRRDRGRGPGRRGHRVWPGPTSAASCSPSKAP